MKRILLFAVSVLVLAVCTPKLTEKVESRFPNGHVQLVKMLDKSGDCVKEIEYYESGQVKMEGPMKNGEREGEWIAYFPDGRPQSIGEFKNGVADGRTLVYWGNGNLRWQGTYKEEMRCGIWKFYDEQGFLLKEIDYGE